MKKYSIYDEMLISVHYKLHANSELRNELFVIYIINIEPNHERIIKHTATYAQTMLKTKMSNQVICNIQRQKVLPATLSAFFYNYSLSCFYKPTICI